MCNFLYKIISKVLVNRLKPYLSSTISLEQSAFIPGRLIHDNSVVAHEVFHYLRVEKRGKCEECALKIDKVKAYDMVEWGFLEEVMRRMGFHDKWVGWVMECITTITYGINVNRKCAGEIKPKRGIRQGDPLSPYLFILVADVMSLMMSNAVTEGRIRGIRMRRTCPVVSPLFFADDSIFFLKAKSTFASELKAVLEKYCLFSGQAVSMPKSSLFF